MTKSTKTVLSVSISIILATGLIWWAMRDLDIESTWESLKRANYAWVALSMVLGIIAYYFRSERWRLLLEPMDYYPSQSSAFYAVCMNYFWNLVIPRSGEIARCTTLYTMDKTPIDKSFGTVISERVVDFICLGFMGLLAIIFNYEIIVNLLIEIQGARATSSEGTYSGIFIIGGIVFVSVLIAIYFWKAIINSLLFAKVKNFFQGLKLGLKTIFLLKQRRKFIILTILIWLFYYFMTYLVVFSLPETSHLSPAVGFYLLLVGGIGMVIPASGGIGAFHSALRIGFVAMGMGKEIGVTFAFLVHTPHTLIALVLGIISIVMMSYQKSKSSL